MGVFSLSESEMRVLTIICTCTVVCQMDLWSKMSKIRQYSHYSKGLEMPQKLNNISFS